MNQLQIFILILMIIFTILSFWTDLKNFWNTGNKFGEGFTTDSLISVTSGTGGSHQGISLTSVECEAYAKKNNYGYGVNDNNPKGCIKTGNEVRYSSGKGKGRLSLCSTTNTCIEKPLITNTYGYGGSRGLTLKGGECYAYAKGNGFGWGINSNNPKGCIKTGNQVRLSEGDGSGRLSVCSDGNTCIEKPLITVTSGLGGQTGISLSENECYQYATNNRYGYGINNNNPKGCIKTGNQVRYSSGDIPSTGSRLTFCSTTNSCIEKPKPYLTVTSGKGGVTGKSLTADECKQYANYNKYGYGINNNNPKGCIKTGNQVRLSTGGGQGRLSMCSTTNSCIEKYKTPIITPEAAAMTAESPNNETPVVNNIAAPPPPEWHDSKLAKQFKLPNGHLVRPGEGVCPNACKIPHYDQKNCANEILDGKEYRTCPWVKDGTNDIDCKSCGAVLIPKNKYGFARTNPALLDVNHVNDVMKITNVKDSKDNKYNMGKNFMKQLSFIRHFALPDSITTDEYVTIGKLVNAHQKYPKSHKIETILTKFINTILRTNSLSENGKNIRASELISAQINSQGGNFDVDEKKLSGEGVLAYKQGLEEAASNNRLGGSKTLYREMTEDSGYTKQYHPRDPRRKPSPYNSIWNIFNY